MKSNLFLRIVSAVVLAPLVLFSIFYGQPAYNLLVAVAGATMAWEWENMISSKTSAVALILATGAVIISFLGAINPVWALGVVLATAVLTYFKSGKKMLLTFGAFYICLPIFSLIYIGNINMEYSYGWILWLLIVVWATDIGGYVFGKSIGGPKIAPKISPKKTWAGLLGGMFFSCLATYAFVKLMNEGYAWDFSMKYLLAGAAIMTVISQIGDIFESKIKRHLNIKDSSNLIPGHGGIFDRVDGLLFAAPVLAFVLYLTNTGVF